MTDVTTAALGEVIGTLAIEDGVDVGAGVVETSAEDGTETGVEDGVGVGVGDGDGVGVGDGVGIGVGDGVGVVVVVLGTIGG
jgi:hypothetical protein